MSYLSKYWKMYFFFNISQDFRSKSNSNVSSSRIQLVGLQLRGQGMFSHVNLPLRAESLEYAWLLELTVGQLTGQLSAPKLSCLVQCLKEFTFSAVDSENQLISSRAFELCQHGRPQVNKIMLLKFLLFMIIISVSF